MIRFAYATLVGLLGAVLVHLAVILLLPLLSSGTAWNTVSSMGADGQPVELDPARQPRLAGSLDPLFRTYACTYDLAEGAFRLRSDIRVPLWTVGVHNTRTTAFFSANDRIAARQRLDIAVVNDFQLRIVRQETPDEFAGSIIAPTQEEQGYVIVRVFAPDATWEPVVERFAASLTCDYVEL